MTDRRDDFKIDYEKVPGLNVTITHLETGLTEQSTEFDIDEAVRRLEKRIAARKPYIGDPGDESDHNRWEGEGGA